MADNFTKGMARNIYYGGGVFFFLLLLGLTFDTMLVLPERDHRENITDAVAAGKHIWEINDCVGCHSIMGEGAYFAPELGNVFDRYADTNNDGVGDDEANFEAFLQNWMAIQPLNVPGRRQMPQFHLSKEDVHNVSEFLIWTSRINNNNWPPNKQG